MFDFHFNSTSIDRIVGFQLFETLIYGLDMLFERVVKRDDNVVFFLAFARRRA
jgi:hypothetical protein